MRRKTILRVLVVLLIVLIFGTVGFVAWAGTPSGVLMDEAKAALQSSATVAVTTDRWLAFTPAGVPPKAGLIYYPGGRVQADAYAPTARAAAEAGYLAVIVPMPLNLAILDINAADRVMAAYPDVKRWVIAGHSLGGSMAARYAASNPGKAAGLILFASYPEAAMDMSKRTDLVVASVYGSLDGLATAAQVEGSKVLCPPDAQFVRLEGGNHAQFGWYGKQERDNDATLPHAEQQARVDAVVLDVLGKVAQ